MYSTADRLAGWLARSVALLGGLVMLALVLLTCVSISGRSLTAIGLNQVHGDFEWMEIGIGFAIFCFMPWTQYARGHARVDLLASWLPALANRLIDLLADILMAGVALLIAWRLYVGMTDMHSYRETTFILQLPTWIAYAAAQVGATSLVLVCAFCIMRSARSLILTNDSVRGSAGND